MLGGWEGRIRAVPVRASLAPPQAPCAQGFPRGDAGLGLAASVGLEITCLTGGLHWVIMGVVWGMGGWGGGGSGWPPHPIAMGINHLSSKPNCVQVSTRLDSKGDDPRPPLGTILGAADAGGGFNWEDLTISRDAVGFAPRKKRGKSEGKKRKWPSGSNARKSEEKKRKKREKRRKSESDENQRRKNMMKEQKKKRAKSETIFQ